MLNERITRILIFKNSTETTECKASGVSRVSGCKRRRRKRHFENCLKMSSRKRGRYQVYHADKSLPEPKVTLWRSRKADANVEVKSFRHETDMQNDQKGPRELVDAFHANLFEQVNKTIIQCDK